MSLALLFCDFAVAATAASNKLLTRATELKLQMASRKTGRVQSFR
ncbi:hypothetical protein V6Z11_D01G177000 [Gossypium hirsutum]